MDGHRPFKPLPLDQSMAFFEWGLNWAIAQYAHHYLIIHSAVVEKNEKTIILPGIPGAGKSTLCAALVHHGWRLLSDEQALISLDAQHVTPVSRPICLKNESINIIKSFCPKATFGEIFLDTNKGDICHVKPPENSIKNMSKLATPHYIVFPRFSRKVMTAKVTPIEKGEALIQVIDHSFNYDALAEQGFKTATQLISNCETFDFEYHRLDEALSLFNKMVEK
jgi:HprK-related kinase A